MNYSNYKKNILKPQVLLHEDEIFLMKKSFHFKGNDQKKNITQVILINYI